MRQDDRGPRHRQALRAHRGPHHRRRHRYRDALREGRVVIGSVLAGAAPAAAQTTAYSLVLTIDSVQQFSPCNSAADGHYSFGCLSVGDSFTLAVSHGSTLTVNVPSDAGLVVASGSSHKSKEQLRSEGRLHAGEWCFPGGRLEPSETSRDAVCRELEEELGIRVEALRLHRDRQHHRNCDHGGASQFGEHVVPSSTCLKLWQWSGHPTRPSHSPSAVALCDGGGLDALTPPFRFVALGIRDWTVRYGRAGKAWRLVDRQSDICFRQGPDANVGHRRTNRGSLGVLHLAGEDDAFRERAIDPLLGHLAQAFDQVRFRHASATAQEIPHLFAYAQLLLAVSHGEGRYGTTYTPTKFWARWREEEFSDAQVAEWKNRLLDAPTQVALFAGKLAAHKSVDDLIAAAARLPGTVTLHIVGSGPEESRYRAAATRAAGSSSGATSFTSSYGSTPPTGSRPSAWHCGSSRSW